MSLLLYANTVEISTKTHFVRSDSVILAPKGIWNQKKTEYTHSVFLIQEWCEENYENSKK